MFSHHIHRLGIDRPTPWTRLVALVVVFSLVLFLEPQIGSAQQPAPDQPAKVSNQDAASAPVIARAHALLKSDQVRTLREAVKIVKQFPKSSNEFLPVVARRSGHPELTELFRWLAKQNPDETVFASVRQSTSELHPEIRELIKTTLDEAMNPPPRPAVAPPVDASPSTAPPQSTQPPSPSSKPSIDGRSEMEHLVAKRKAIFDEIPGSGALGNLDDQESKLNELLSRPKNDKLTPIQWHFVFDVHQQPARAKGRSSSDRYTIEQLASKAKSIIVARFIENIDLVWGFLADPQYTLCYQLVQPIARSSADPQILSRYLWILADSENEMLRSAAMNMMPFKQSFVDDYIEPLIERMKIRPDSSQHFSSVVILIASNASIDAKQKLLEFLLIHLRHYLESSDSIPERIRQIEIVDQASYLLLRISPAEHPKWMDSILRYAQESKKPAAFLLILDRAQCDLRPASGQLHKAFEAESNRPNRLAIARLLYRALGKYSGVTPYFYSVVAQETPERYELIEALKGIQEIGQETERADKVTSDLVRLLALPRYLNQRSSILTTLAAIGHKADTLASPVLLEMLADPQHKTYHYSMIRTLDKIRPDAPVCLPVLTMIALNQNAKCEYNHSVRGSAIRLIATYGAEAKRYAKRLVPLTESSSSAYLASAAKIAIMEIESAR